MDTQTMIILAIIGALVLLIIAALLMRFTVVATIKGFSWERKVLLEHYVWVQETSYRGYPEDSRNHQSTTERYQHYEVLRYETRTTTVNATTTTTTQPVYGFVTRRRT